MRVIFLSMKDRLTWRPTQHRGACRCSQRRLRRGTCLRRRSMLLVLPLCLLHMQATARVTRMQEPKQNLLWAPRQAA